MRSRLGQWASLSFALAMAGAVLLGPATKARATLTLNAVETGGPTLNVVDNGPGDINPAVGNITLGNTTTPITFGDFSVLGSVSTSDSPGNNLLTQLVSTALSITNNDSVAHTITLMISDTGFTKPSPPVFGASASGTFNVADDPITGLPLAPNVNGNSAHALAFADFTNTLFGTGLKVQDFSFSTDTQGLTTATYSNNVPNTIVGPSTTPYSMTVELVFTVAGNNQLSSRNDTITAINTVVPEPATLAMAFSVLPLLGLAAWRKRRKSA